MLASLDIRTIIGVVKQVLVSTFVTLMAVSVLVAQVKVTPGTDVIVGTGVNMDFLNHQPSSLSALSVKIASIGGRPTYATGTFETAFASLAKGTISGGVVSPRAGITQVLQTIGYVHIWIHTQGGVVKFDSTTLGQLEGAVGLSWDVGGSATHGKYHIYLTPYARQVSITSLQVKPVYGIMIQSGFSKGQ